MSMDPRAPVLVGIGAIEQRLDDPHEGVEAYELMARALEAAAEDAGSRELLADAASIRVPRGFWRYADPGRLVADRIGAGNVRTTLAEVGILQQTLLSDACRAIASGDEEIALVTGGEARYRDLRARIEGVELSETVQEGAQPDEVLEPKEPLLSDLEMQRGVMMPVRAFALMDTALRHADGIDIDAHRDRVARLWANMSEVAASNPHAWCRKPISFEEIRDAGGKNRMMSFPYTKRHNSDWNVDQAAGLIFCSFEKAVALGLDETRFVYPLSATESNHGVSFAARPELHRSPGAAIAGRRALELAGTRANEVEHLEIYSCFPAPVQVFARELDLPDDRPLTVTGGMPFAGGPLNNYVLQATVRMAEVLRQDPGDKGLVTCISGFHNKQGFGLWSTTPPVDGFVFEDCTAEVASSPDGGEIELVGDYSGAAQIATYTVVYLGDEPAEGVAICDLPDGRRTIGVTRDAALLSAMVSEEFCGRAVRVTADGDLTLS